MRIFVCSDLHGQNRPLLALNSYLGKYHFDAVFMLGDLCNQNDSQALVYAKRFIDIVKSYDLPLFVVHGNQEPAAVRLLYQQEGISVHFNPKKLGEYEVTGVGFGDHFPTDPTFAKGKLLLTHEPPRAATIRQMEKMPSLPNAPLMHFSGHLHNLAKVHPIGETVLVQVPTAMNYRAAEVVLPQKLVTFVRFGLI